MKEVKLLIFDVGGVLRDSKGALHFAYKKGFETVGLEYPFSPEEAWHLRGIGKYNSSYHSIKALIAVIFENVSLKEILYKKNAEEILDEIIRRNASKISEEKVNKIRKEYKKIFRSEEVKGLIKTFPYAEKAVDILLDKKYELAIFTNTSKETVKRDISFYKKFKIILGEEDTEKKPSGKGITMIREELGFSEKETAYVGDSQIDVLAAKNARVRSIAVLSGMGLKIHLETLNPDYIFENILEMSKKL